jgi:TonB-linked SusC/RagA family outer membrane protein
MRSRVLSVLAMLALAAAPRSALAQGEALLTGKVTSVAGAPVENAQVFLDKMALGTQTRSDGTYRFSVPAARATGQQALLTVHIIGYKPKTATITLSPGTINTDFVLEAQATVLQQIVITGEGTITTNEKLGVTVNRVGSDMLEKSNEPNLTEALAGKAPNVAITSESGDPGSSVNIQIRGIKSFSGDGQPLFVVDGVPVDNQSINVQGVEPSVQNAEQGTVAPNRISDLNPNDVESVTILKGSAAAAIYGARAAQGVVLITTKSGRSGATQYSLHSSYSFDKVTHGYPLQNTYGQGNNGFLADNGVLPDTDAYSSSHSWGQPLAPGTKTYDHFTEMFETGHIADNNISISGGDDRRTFFLSGGINNNNGFVVGPNDSYKRSTIRLKASQLVGDKFKLGGNLSYIDTRGSFIQRGDNTSGIMLGGLRTPPEWNNLDFRASNGEYKSYRFQTPSTLATAFSRGYDNPFFITSEAPATEQLSRILGNIDINWEPFQWLKIQETAGADYYTDQRLEALPLGNATTPDGQVIRADFNNYILDHNLTAIASHTFAPWFAGTFTIGQNLNSTDFHQIFDLGTTLIAPKPYVITNVISVDPNDNETLVHRESYFGQATADLWDQLFLTGALRNDGFSTFGANDRRHWFPKASAAWNFTKAIAGLSSQIDFAKIRVAYGETGKEPLPYSTLSSFAVGRFGEYGGDASGILRTIYQGQAGLIGPLAVGSDSLRPERTREYEGGLDFGLFKNFMDVGISYYDSKTSDVIFLAPTPPSSGSTQIIKNAATITNKGWEVTSNLHPVRGQNFNWDVGLVWGRNRNLVTNLSGATDIAVGSQAIVSTFARVGFPTGSMAGHDWVRCGRGLNVGGDDIDTDVCQGKPAGTLYIAANGFPVIDEDNLRIVGTAQPDWNGSVHTSVTFFKHWNASALLDIKHGGQMYDGTRGALYVYGTHKDTDIRGQTFVFGPSANGVRGFHGDPAVAGPGAGTPVIIDQNWFEGDGGAFSDNVTDFIENSGFTKLREVSLAYTFTQPWVSRSLGLNSIELRVAGRNLVTWTHYAGLDPESQLGGATLVGGFDWFNNPQTRSFVVTVGLNR